MWRGLFDPLLWVPLRNLKLEERCRIPRYNLGNLFSDEYFSQSPKGGDFAKAFWDEVKDSKGSRTLFILDGLDEVAEDLKGDMLRFLAKTLLTQPNVIITTRPHYQLPALATALETDLELETIG